ncbi:MAG: PaaI family thioesterase [Proteobacteria bacterium]|nr:PaaI family thioesterase [Pseudomonadota bacterium]
MNENTCFQDVWMGNTCYGCGPANHDGMHIKSRWSDDGQFVIAEYLADAKYNSGMPDVMYGGTVASLVDCHSIWTAIAFAYKSENRILGSEPLILCVTGKLSITFIKPTPISKPLHLKAWVEGGIDRKVNVICELGPSGDMTARAEVTAVKIT